MLNHYTTKMTRPLETWIIHLSFLHFYTVIQSVYCCVYYHNPYFHTKCLFTKIQSKYYKVAIYCNTLKHNTLIVSSLDCYVCIMKFQRIVLLFGVYLTFKLSKYIKVHIPALFLTIHLFLVNWKGCWTSLEKWSSQNQTSQTSSTYIVYD